MDMTTEHLTGSIDFNDDFPNKIDCIPFAKYSDNLIRSSKDGTIKKTRAIVVRGVGEVSIHEISLTKPKKKEKQNQSDDASIEHTSPSQEIVKTISFKNNCNQSCSFYSAKYSHSFVTRDNSCIIAYHPVSRFYNAYNIKEDKWLSENGYAMKKLGAFGRRGVRCLFISDELLVISTLRCILFYFLTQDNQINDSNMSTVNNTNNHDYNYKWREKPYLIGKYILETDVDDLGYRLQFNDHGLSLIEYNGRRIDKENGNIQHKFSLMLFGGDSGTKQLESVHPPFLQSFLRLDVSLTIPIKKKTQNINQAKKQEMKSTPKPIAKLRLKDDKNYTTRQKNAKLKHVLIKEIYIDYRKIKLINFEEKVNLTNVTDNDNINRKNMYSDNNDNNKETNTNVNNNNTNATANKKMLDDKQVTLTEKGYLSSFGTQTVLNRAGERIIIIIGGSSSEFINDISLILYNVDKNEMIKIKDILPFSCTMTPASILIDDSCLVLQDCRYCLLDLKKLFNKVGCMYGGYGFDVRLNWKFERIIWIAFYKNNENDKCLIDQLPKDIV